jgi:hypothetical protein
MSGNNSDERTALVNKVTHIHSNKSIAVVKPISYDVTFNGWIYEWNLEKLHKKDGQFDASDKAYGIALLTKWCQKAFELGYLTSEWSEVAAIARDGSSLFLFVGEGGCSFPENNPIREFMDGMKTLFNYKEYTFLFSYNSCEGIKNKTVLYNYVVSHAVSYFR